MHHAKVGRKSSVVVNGFCRILSQIVEFSTAYDSIKAVPWQNQLAAF